MNTLETSRADDQDRDRLTRLFYVYAYTRGRFLLSSGRESDYYLDGKQVIFSGAGLSCAARLLLASMLEDGTAAADAVGGLSFGAAPLAAAVSACSTSGGKVYSGFVVRKESKEHGTRARIDGPFFRGIRTVIVDDVLTTGSSLLQAARAVQEEGGQVLGTYVLVDRLEGGREAVEEEGYALRSLITRADIESLDGPVRERCGALLEALEARPPRWAEVAELCRGALNGSPSRPAENLPGRPPGWLSLMELLARVGEAGARSPQTLPAPAGQLAAACLRAVKGSFIFPGQDSPAAVLHRLAQGAN